MHTFRGRLDPAAGGGEDGGTRGFDERELGRFLIDAGGVNCRSVL